jgi:hypothetical protein
MRLHRRTVLKIGLGASATPFLIHLPAGLRQGLGDRSLQDQVVQANPLPTKDVRLLGGPLKHAQDLDAEYLLALEPDRMLAFYRERAGLEPKAEPYGGWDGGGRNLTGHIGGHYLSGVSLMWAATGDVRFKERADYIVAELEEVQDAHGDGYLVALEGGRRCFDELARGEIRSAAFDLNGEWSPWYTLHKTYAGLRDAYRHTGNRTALDVEIAFAGWAEKVLSGLDDAQIQHMLNTEFGGMNEIMVDLYADTGDERWLELSYKFEHRAFIEPLARHQDNLAGVHGNTQIPKLVGSADRFALIGDAADVMTAGFFWDRVVQHHSFASGGHGKDEYFGPPDQINGRVDGRTAETCNVYNMLKLTRVLFAFSPDAHYADFHERALFNHILASIDPEDGRTCYMVPVGRGVQREYQDMFSSFTCCVGSGMESHALHGDGIYYQSGDRLWVNLYAPSEAKWDEAGVGLTMDTDFPMGESATLTMSLASPKQLTLALRRPFWAGEGFSVWINGRAFDTSDTDPRPPREGRQDAPDDPRGLRRYDSDYLASAYVEIDRQWRNGDTVQIALPKTLRLEPVPDNPRRASIMWGPLVLAGDLGPEPERRRSEGDGDEQHVPPKVPVFVAADRPVAEWLKPVAGSPGTFRSDGVGREPDESGRTVDVTFVPMYALHRRLYSTYWDFFTPAEWAEEKAEYAAAAERVRRLEAATVAYLEPGEAVFDRPFNFQGGEDSVPQRILGRPGRRGGSWFSYDVPVQADHPMTMILTFYSLDRRGTPASFDILIDGQVIATQDVDRSEPPRFFDLEYEIPARLVAGKESVTVRFEAAEGSQIATVFGIRMIRGDDPR